MNIPVTIRTLARLVALTTLGYALAFVSPVSADADAQRINIGLLAITGVILALLVAQAADRRRRLLDAVRKELNKLRRLYHISKNLSAASQRFRGWFTDVHGFLYEYLRLFSGRDLRDYDTFNSAFRKLSYHIYAIPEVETRKEEALFDDLLRTTASIAEARQQIKEMLDNRLTVYGWSVVFLMAGGSVLTTLLAAGGTSVSRIAAGAVIVAVLLAVDLLWEVDTLAAERGAIAKRYADNLAKLELGRRVD